MISGKVKGKAFGKGKLKIKKKATEIRKVGKKKKTYYTTEIEGDGRTMYIKDDFKVEAIYDIKEDSETGETLYEVKWEGWAEKYNTWQKSEDFGESNEVFEDFLENLEKDEHFIENEKARRFYEKKEREKKRKKKVKPIFGEMYKLYQKGKQICELRLLEEKEMKKNLKKSMVEKEKMQRKKKGKIKGNFKEDEVESISYSRKARKSRLGTRFDILMFKVHWKRREAQNIQPQPTTENHLFLSSYAPQIMYKYLKDNICWEKIDSEKGYEIFDL